MKPRVVILPLLALLLVACSREGDTRRHAFFALGTVVEISIHQPASDSDSVFREVESELLAQDQRWHAWQEGSLANVNRRWAAGEAVAVDDEMSAGIHRSRELARLSGNRFNPAIGRLVSLWGFHEEARATKPPPTPSELAARLPVPVPAALRQGDDGRWQSEDPALWLDLGAMAKGLAVEAAAAVLARHGIRNAIINAGGDLKTLGRHGDRAWRIGVREARGDGVLASLQAADGDSVFTSGDYERFFEYEGERFHHILDPANGRPARGVISVTVIHRDAVLADAAATALFVAGDEWPEVAKAMDIEHVMMVRADGGIELSPGMQERVSFEGQPPSSLKVR